MDTFQHEPDPSRKNTWRVVRVQANGERFPLAARFTKEHTAAESAYRLQVKYERRYIVTTYVGD